MTIPAGDNWCPTCQEACHDHPQVCTVCGSTLTTPPLSSIGTRQSSVPAAVGPSPELTRALDAWGETLAGLREDLRNFPNLTEAMDPQPANNSSSRPASDQYLRDLPRIHLEEHNALFHQATVEFDKDANRVVMEAIPGDWARGSDGDEDDEALISNAAVVVSEPSKTGKGGLSPATTSAIQSLQKQQQKEVLLYMERGEITFVDKALMAQAAGAVGVIVGNNTPEPWPYIMRDSKGEAVKRGLKIPVVMVKCSHGETIVERFRGARNSRECIPVSLSIKKQKDKDCVVCADAFEVGQTVIRLPACGHVFHQDCALKWLQQHNTCPYCRRELPTDDVEYERERRRNQRTHAGTNQANTEWHDLYA